MSSSGFFADETHGDALLRLNPWGQAALSSPAQRRDAAFLRARRAATQDRLAEGPNAWNAWAMEMRSLGRVLAEDRAAHRAWRDAAWVDFDGLETSEPLDLAGLVFPAHVSMRAVRAPDALWLQGARINGSLDLSDAVIGELDATRCGVDAGLKLARAQIAARAELRGLVVDEAVDATDAVFSGDVWANGARLGAGSVFTGAHFDGEAGFGGVRFTGDVTFRAAQFARTAGFERAVFMGRADFERCRFRGAVDFRRARLEDEAPFGGAEFASAPRLDETSFAAPPVRSDIFSGDETKIIQLFSAGARDGA